MKLPSFARFLADELLRSSHMNATRHFIITSETEDDSFAKPLLIWVFLDDFGVSVTPASTLLSLLDIPSTFRASKVMFRQDDVEQNGQDEWTSPMHAERMTLPSEWCLRLFDILKASNVCYPSSQRTFLTPLGVANHPNNNKTEKQMHIWQTGFLPKM